MRREWNWKHKAALVIYSNAIQRSRRSGIEFTIKHEDVVIPDFCPVFGIKLQREGKDTWRNAPSIDRIDNTKGYTKENIVIVSRRANILKKDATFDELEMLANYYSQFNKPETDMNIFFLDRDPVLAALYHNDVHVTKMVLETAQLLCTVQRYFGNDNRLLYRPTHANHPCCLWLRESKGNYEWTYQLFLELAEQFNLRYGKQHASYIQLKDILSIPPPELEEKGMTPVKLAMPDQYRQNDPVQAYRDYYMGEKARFSTWRHPATIPPWFIVKELK